MTTDRVRLADLILALSLATDLGMGQPTGHAARTCIRAVAIARELGLPADEVSTVLYVSLLRYLGCTADAAELAALSGDEIWLARAVARSVMGTRSERTAPTGIPDPERMMAASMRAHCEAAELLAGRLGMPAAVRVALGHAFERWDGQGHPAGLLGTDIPMAVRIAVVARDVEIWEQEAGSAATAEMLQARRGRAYDPSVVDACQPVRPLGAVGRDEVLDAEPHPGWIREDQIDGVLEVFADFADLKAPLLLGHSRRVAELAAVAAQVLGLGDLEAQRLRRAGLVHDLGRVAISASIWNKPTALAEQDWERVRMHPYYTERVLKRSPPLTDLAELAGSHHERLDGSGYFRGSQAGALSMPARILAAADEYASATPERSVGAVPSAEEPEARVLSEARAGRLDTRAVAAVLEAAGHTGARPAYRGPAGLTQREQQVLCLATRGLTIGQIASRLTISPKTVDRHLQNSYAKIGVTSRAAAAVFVVSHGLQL